MVAYPTALRIILLRLVGIVALLRLLLLLRILPLLRGRRLLWILLLIGIAVARNPVAVPIVGAVGAGLRSGDLTVRIAWVVGITRIVGITGVVGVTVAWAIAVRIRSAKAKVESSAIISAIARPTVIARSRVASPIVARASRIAASSD